MLLLRDIAKSLNNSRNNAGVSSSNHFHISTYIGWLSALNLSCNGYVYMLRSTEYKTQMWKLVGVNKNTDVLFSRRTLPQNDITKF